MRIDDVTPSWKSVSVEKSNMQDSNSLRLRYLMFFGLSKIVSVKCTSSGLIMTEVTLFSKDCKAMKSDYNQGIKTRISVSEFIRT